MKNLLFPILAFCLLQASLVSASVTHTQCSPEDMILRADAESRYLLLPIEEAAPEYRIQVLEKGAILRTIIVHLTTSGHTDYLVPVDLSTYSDRASLQFMVHASPEQLKQIAWNEIRTSDSFDTTNWDKYRPAYHHTPLYGWMNDPNGMFYKDGVWHLYFQYNPYCSLWQNMSWGHSTSRDLIHWEQQPLALEGNCIGAIFSGSAAVDYANTTGFGEGAVVAMYTSAMYSGQHQCLVYSHDGGQTFEQFEGNPLLTSNQWDFRDPNFFYNEQTKAWNLALAVGQEVRFYSSPDMKHWTYESAFGAGYGNHDGVWECPDLFELPEIVKGKATGKSKWVLLLNINPGGPNGGSATQYFVGQWDGHNFTCEHTDTRWMDYGKDHYATVSFWGAPNGRRTVIGWMSNWQYADRVPTRQFRSANTIARDLFLYTVDNQTYLGSRPSPEYDEVSDLKADNLDRTLKIKGSCTITLSNDEDEYLTIVYDEKKMTLSVDRSHSGEVDFAPEFANAPAVAPVLKKLRSMRLFIDKCSVELFGNDGEVVMTTLVFPKSTYNKVTVNK